MLSQIDPLWSQTLVKILDLHTFTLPD
uniref:Uncharacterized protein n=1 Tax=Tetranychus urticae TaxID=32264 RepID=T1KR04_TETUR